MLATSAHLVNVSPNGTELSRLINAAVVNKQFCKMLLSNPAQAVDSGYNSAPFRLAAEDKELVLSIRATSLTDFAMQLTKGRNGKGDHK